MKIYLAPDVILSYILKTSHKVDELFLEIDDGKHQGIISTVAWYEVLACLKQTDNISYKRLADVCFICEFMKFPDEGILKEQIKQISQERIDKLRNLAYEGYPE